MQASILLASRVGIALAAPPLVGFVPIGQDRAVRYRFGELELDAAACTLTRAGAALRVWPKVFDVLRYLVERHGQLVTKQELLDALWLDSHVDEVAVPWTISHARRALGQRSGAKSPIETVHGRGYRFNAEVVVLTDAPLPPSAAQKREGTYQELPFVGRDDVMQRLHARLGDAKQGKGSLCLLVGAAGIGKTRCSDELRARADAEGFSVWTGRSIEDAWAPVFWPWTEIVRAAIAERPTLAARGQALLDGLRAIERSGGDRNSDADEPAHASDDDFAWIHGVSRLLLDAASERPIVLLLDDVHWADAATIDMLAFLAPELRRAPVLAIATQRDGSAASHKRELKRLSRHAERIELGPLTTRDVERCIRFVAQASAPGAELFEAVHRATAGNPLFLQQTLRTLVARHGDALASLTPAAVEPAPVARDVLGASLHMLDEEARELLAHASVLGERFELATLQELSGLRSHDVLSALDRAAREGFVLADEPIAFRFCHALLRSVLYDGLPATQRTLLHRRAAEILERSAAFPRHGEVAHHYYSSLALGDYERVSAAASAAARAASRLHAFADAATYCGWAVAAQALQTDVSPRARAELLLFHAQMQSNAGLEQDAQRTVSSLLAIARPLGFGDLLVRAARILRPWHLMGAMEDPTVLAILEEALQSAPEGANDVRISALSQLAWVPPYSLDLRRSQELSGRALELARELGHEPALLRALNARLHALSGPDDVDALLSAAAEMLAIDRAPSAWASAAAYGARYGALLYRGDLAGADATRAELGQLARIRQWPTTLWYHDRLAAQRALLSGDFAGVSDTLVELRERGQRLRFPYSSSLLDILQGLLLLEQHGARALGSSADLTPLRTQLQTAPVNVQPSLARLLLALGEPAPAKAVLEAFAADGFASVPRDLSYLHALASLATIAIALDDRPRADALYALLAPYPHHNTPNSLLLYEGSVSHFLALLAAYSKRDAVVAQHFDDALAMNERIGQRPQLARSCFEYASWLHSRDDRDARGRASALFTRALELARELKMAPLVERAEAALLSP